jgi:Uma2 family endonuclease
MLAAMVAARGAVQTPPSAVHVDQRVFLHEVSWQAYEALLAWRGEGSVPRLTYLSGELELMSPSLDHEGFKTRLARIFEAWAEEVDVQLEGAGSWTIRKRSVKRGVEPDECYFVGPLLRENPPDIAIEVVWTHGGIDKLEVYRKLGVREVWIWQDGELAFHALRGESYERCPRSEVLPAFDPRLAARCMAADSQTAAVKKLREAMQAMTRKKRGPKKR